MADVQTAGAPPSVSSKPRFVRMKVALGMLPEPDGGPSYIWLERWDSFIVAAFVAVGVPLLAWLQLPIVWRLRVALAWAFVWLIFFFYFEGRELIGQMMGRGSIKPEQLSDQQNTAQDPFWGVTIAAVMWLVIYLVHVALIIARETQGLEFWPGFQTATVAVWNGFWTTPLPYGWIEWALLAQVWFGTRYANHIIYNVGNIFSKAAPMGERVERRVT
jgi:hypothetical protein